MIVDELLKQIPDVEVKYIHKEEDPRDYRVKFDILIKSITTPKEVRRLRLTEDKFYGMEPVLYEKN